MPEPNPAPEPKRTQLRRLLAEPEARAIATKLTQSLTARKELEALEKTWELLEFLRELYAVVQPRAANAPRPGRSRRILATVLLPGEHEIQQSPSP